jgi:hypothetical protein
MIFGNQKINKNPCTPADEAANWATVNNFLENFQTFIDLGAISDHKVSSDAADEALAGANYLGSKIYYSGSQPANSIPILHEIKGDKRVAFYLDPEQILGYSATGSFNLSLDDSDLAWTPFSGSVDNFTVQVTAGDTTASYLHDAFNLNATYINNADLLVGTETVGVGGTNQKERLFVDISTITGWHATEFRILTIAANVSEYVTTTALVDYILVNETFIEEITTNVAFEKKRAIRGAASGTTGSAATTFSINNIFALDSGLDPRVDPDDPAETVTVYNIPSESHDSGTHVWADWNEEDGHWDARPRKPTTATSNIRLARVVGVDGITGADDNLIAHWGDGMVRLMNDDTGALDEAEEEVTNPLIGQSFEIDAQVEIDMAFTPPRVRNGTCGPVTWADED